MMPLQTWTLFNGFSSSRNRVDHSPSPAQVHQTRDTTRMPRQQDMEQRGCKVGLNASGEKIYGFYVVKYSSYIYFLSRASTVARETCGAPRVHGAGGWVRGQSWRGFGSVLSPVSPWYHPSVLWGSPSEASGIWVWFSWGRDVPPRMAGLRPQPRWGSFGGTKRMAEGSCPDG